MRLSRRSFLAGSGLALGAVAASGTVAGCSIPRGAGPGGSTLNIANRPENIDPGPDGSVSRFQRKTGIITAHTESIDDDEGFFLSTVKAKNAGGAIDADLVVVNAWMAAQLISLGWLEPLVLELIPNSVNLVPELTNPPWDLLERYTLPWQSGMVVIAYNENETDVEITGPDDLFDERLKGRVSLLPGYRDTLGVFGIAEGIDITRSRFNAFASVFDRLGAATASGQFRSYDGNGYLDALVSGELAVALARSGDAARLAFDHPEIKLVVPPEGTVMFSDVMAVPKGFLDLEAAMQWMNFVYDPSNAAKITEHVRGISPVAGIGPRLLAMSAKAAALVDNPVVLPSAQTREGLQLFGVLSTAEEVDFFDGFADLLAAQA